MDRSDDYFIGEIVSFSYENIPNNFIVCDGRELPMQEYQELFAVIQFNFGGNQHKMTFAIPNLVDKVVVHQGRKYSHNKDFQYAKTYGSNSTKLKATNLPNINLNMELSNGMPEVSEHTPNKLLSMNSWFVAEPKKRGPKRTVINFYNDYRITNDQKTVKLDKLASYAEYPNYNPEEINLIQSSVETVFAICAKGIFP